MNLPNQLTISRLVMTMIFVGFAAVPVGWRYPLNFWPYELDHLLCWRFAYVLAVLAAITDFLDGYLARKLNLVTDFGKLMDPLSDKIFTVSSFVVLTAHAIVPAWVTVLILAREFSVTGLRTMAAKSGEIIAAKDTGKVKTVLQMLVLAFGGCYWVDWVEKDELGFRYLWPVILWGVVLVTIYSGVVYFWNCRRLYMKDT